MGVWYGNDSADKSRDDIVISGNTVHGLRRSPFDSGFQNADSNDYLHGNGGDDILEGYGGIDSLYGGDGNDDLYGNNQIYVFHTDDLKPTQPFYQADNDAGDHLYGGDGNDRLFGQQGDDQIHGENDDDKLDGGEGNDVLDGDDGNDVLDGGFGVDRLRGGLGDDTYHVDDASDFAGEWAGEGMDVVVTKVSYVLAAGSEVETLRASAGASFLNLTGNEFGQLIEGDAGDNVINGKAGVDTMRGLDGDDIYYVDNATDQVEETAGGGTDLVATNISYTLRVDVEVETLRTTSNGGTASINLTGNVLTQTIIGNAGVNVLHDGGGAADTLIGLGGNDTYRVFNSGDIIRETASQGLLDVVMAAVDYTLAAGAYVERLATNGTAGTSGIDLTGNSIAQEVIGNAGANILKGMGGGDHIRGLEGKDTLMGGSGGDYFGFNSPLNAATNVDNITDFSVADDTIELYQATFTALTTTGILAASAFRANTTGVAGDASDRIIYETDTGKLFYDADGTGAGAGVQFAVLTTGLSLTNSDFAVV